MSYLRILKRKTGKQYYYIMKSVRKGDRVTTKVLEYLGESPSRERLRRACEYWGVKKPKKTKRRR
jgi:hypothetical protein